ncbi:MAG: stage III sporulation protein AE [Oscillospiraceae bacterium]|nr:stage III sporulation protein AE [Oscillospiraceae bacterium]
MGRKIILFVLMLILLTLKVSAIDYESELGIDFENLQVGDAEEFLENNEVDISDPETIQNISAGSILNYFVSAFKSALKKPASVFICVLVISLVSEAVMSISQRSGIYGEIFTLICFLCITPMIISSFSDMLSVMKSQEAFMASYIPIFATITAASGNTAGAGAYNALVLYASEAVSLIAGQVLKPILVCMLVMSCTQAVNPDLPNLTGTLKRALTYIVGIIMTVFVGVIGLQTTVGRTGNSILLRAGKYLVSSFVPLIGMSLSESYQAVSQSLGTLRSAVGALGIVIIVLILAVPIITMCIYRTTFIILDWTCSITGSYRLSALMRGIGDVYSLGVTLLIIYALMFLISTGMIMLIGSEAYI